MFANITENAKMKIKLFMELDIIRKQHLVRKRNILNMDKVSTTIFRCGCEDMRHDVRHVVCCYSCCAGLQRSSHMEKWQQTVNVTNNISKGSIRNSKENSHVGLMLETVILI